jgi:hypothetical protein
LSSSEQPLLDINLPSDYVGSEERFERVDLGLALSSFSLVDTRWRQTDFDQAEFRRSFARDAMRETMKGFRSVQVSPVSDRDLPKTWISGNFSIDDDVRLATPAGGASLTFHSPEEAPTGWKKFCSLLGPLEEERVRAFGAGNWYRLKLSMDLTIEDGLDWPTM